MNNSKAAFDRAYARIPRGPKPRGPDLLFRLPSELRNTIYDLAFPPNACAKPTAFNKKNNDDPTTIHLRYRSYPTAPPLLSTSKAIRAEAGSLYYGTRAFTLAIASSDPDSEEVKSALRFLGSLVRSHGKETFEKGVELSFSSDEVAEKVMEFVWSTGMLLGGERVSVMAGRIAPGEAPSAVAVVTRFLRAEKAVGMSRYAVYQATLLDGGRYVPLWHVVALAMGLVAFRHGWDEGELRREGQRQKSVVGKVEKKKVWVDAGGERGGWVWARSCAVVVAETREVRVLLHPDEKPGRVEIEVIRMGRRR